MHAYLLFYTIPNIKTNLTNDEKELMYRATNRDTDGVLSLIHKGVDVDVQDEKGMTPLMFAAQAGHVKLVVKLIEAGSNMNIQSNSGDTALIYATKKNKINCVQKLIELGANVNIQGGNGQTALNHATINKDGSCLEMLLEGDANPHIVLNNGILTPLLLAINLHNLVGVDKLIRAGVNVNYAPRNGIVPLCAAAFRGKVDIVKELIEAGADLNAGRTTPLYLAAKEGHIGCVKELIQAGADLNIVDGNGNTPLTAATRSFFFDCLSTLLKAGAEVDTTYLAFMAIVTSCIWSHNSEGTVHNTHYENMWMILM